MTIKEKVRELLENGVKQTEIAKQLGITQCYVSHIKNNDKGRLRVKRNQAKYKNIDWNLNEGDLVYPEYCPLLEIKLDYNSGKDRSYWPSIDRKDPSKGYTKDNCWIISYKANRLKNDGSLEELNLLVKNLNKYNN